MRVGEALRRGILAGSLLVSAGGCSGRDILHDQDGTASGARGGSAPIGGAGGTGANSSGGTGGVGGSGGGTGGTGAGGTSGMGGSLIIVSPQPLTCPDCPSADYGVTVHGDGSDLELLFNAPTDQEPMCASQPLLGSLGGCGGSRIFFHACEAPNGEGACLEVTGPTALYTDRDGRAWTGRVISYSARDQIVETDGGDLTVEFEADGDRLVLTAEYLYCVAGFQLLIVC